MTPNPFLAAKPVPRQKGGGALWPALLFGLGGSGLLAYLLYQLSQSAPSSPPTAPRPAPSVAPYVPMASRLPATGTGWVLPAAGESDATPWWLHPQDFSE